MKGYTTRQEIENYLLITVDASFYDQVNTWIGDMETFIDKLTGRNFFADTTASARLFDGQGGQDLDIDECVSITKVEVGNDSYGDSRTEIAAGGSSGYYTMPANLKNNLGETLPIKAVRLRSRNWIPGFQNHRITAKWGYSAAAPGPVKRAATVLVAGVINFARTQASEGVKSESIGNYSVTYDSAAGFEDLRAALAGLEQYRKHTL